MLKGETGDVNTFTLTKEAADTADATLAQFTFDGVSGGMVKTQSALDSIVKIDGIEHQNDTNTLDTALPFVRIDLNKASPGTLVTLASTEPTSSVKDLLKDFVGAYNQLRSALNEATAAGTDTLSAGALAGDAGVRDMMRKLASISTTALATGGQYSTLSDIGVSTNPDGTLKLDEARLDSAIAADPQWVAQMINPAVSTAATPGLAKIVSDVKDAIKADNGSLASSKSKYDKLAAEYAKQMEKLNQDMDNYEERLSSVYTAMETKLMALKATQSYLDQQIAIWNNKDDN